LWLVMDLTITLLELRPGYFKAPTSDVQVKSYAPDRLLTRILTEVRFQDFYRS
jgi:hypothetical protein